jgi:hypothetical protein
MIARIVLGGMTAKQWAQVNGIDREPRDSMSAGQLEHLSYLESTNITLIDMGMEYGQRKAELIRLSQRWLAKRLGWLMTKHSVTKAEVVSMPAPQPVASQKEIFQAEEAIFQLLNLRGIPCAL